MCMGLEAPVSASLACDLHQDLGAWFHGHAQYRRRHWAALKVQDKCAGQFAAQSRANPPASTGNKQPPANPCLDTHKAGNMTARRQS